mmetsp:Transcript_77725/g.155650  ORF Transcript_77725/g.155650 Transcript_77725/m.155650 type:complete len:160 (+) Transcript_77725:1052-1531(+)
MDGFVAELDDDGKPITEDALSGSTEPANTAEWIWQAKSAHKDFHDNMDGVGFEWWLSNRLIPAFENNYLGKKMILAMDNASYHHQLNTKLYPEGKTPPNASKGLNAHALRLAKCKEINTKRGDTSMNYLVPLVEPVGWKAHREGVSGAKAPNTGEEGTV